MSNEIFKANPDEGIILVRTIAAPIRRPISGTDQYELGASDRSIAKEGFLLFNYHPDQWGGGHIYSIIEAPGTKVNGLPVRLMDSREQAIKSISSGKIQKAWSMRSTTRGGNDGAILVASFTVEQVRKMGGIGINTPFDRQEGLTSALLDPVVEKDDLLLKIRDMNELAKLYPGLRIRFNSEGYLLGSLGELFIPRMLPIEEYRDQILVFRPDKEGEGFHSYWLRDTREGREGREGEVSRL